MNEHRKFPWLIVILASGCAFILCIGALVIGGGAAFIMINRAEVSTANPTFEAVVTLEAVVETEIPFTPLDEDEATPDIPTPSPTVTRTEHSIESTESSQSPTGNQKLSEFSLTDDFSSDALGWPEYDDGKTVLQYRNQAYNFKILEPDYYDWAYFPVSFIPYEIQFDVQGPEGEQNGTFGVFCNFLDDENYYFVEIDLFDSTYYIGQFAEGEEFPLTQQGDVGYWQDASPLKMPPDSTNRIAISCYQEIITLFINDEWVNEVSVTKPSDRPGEGAFFVYAYDFAGENGYEITIDNVEIWQPQQ